MMSTLHFKAPSKEALEEALTSLGWYRQLDSGEKVFNFFQDEGVFVVVTGTLSRGGRWDDEGNQIEAPIVSAGYHMDATIEGDVPDALATWQVFPEHPHHIIGGGNG